MINIICLFAIIVSVQDLKKPDTCVLQIRTDLNKEKKIVFQGKDILLSTSEILTPHPSFLTTRYPNGNKKSEGPYKAGKKAGIWKTWYENGCIQSKIHYKNDLMDGVCIWWYSNNTISQKIHYRKGKKEGIQTIYDSIQRTKIGTYYYKDNTLHGPFREYFNNGTLKTAAYYKNGKAEGLCRYYARDGNLMLECNFVNGREQGTFTFFYENGFKAIEGTMKNGRFDGSLKEWNNDGSLTRETIYQDGAPVIENN